MKIFCVFVLIYAKEKRKAVKQTLSNVFIENNAGVVSTICAAMMVDAGFSQQKNLPVLSHITHKIVKHPHSYSKIITILG